MNINIVIIILLIKFIIKIIAYKKPNCFQRNYYLKTIPISKCKTNHQSTTIQNESHDHFFLGCYSFGSSIHVSIQIFRKSFFCPEYTDFTVETKNRFIPIWCFYFHVPILFHFFLLLLAKIMKMKKKRIWSTMLVGMCTEISFLFFNFIRNQFFLQFFLFQTYRNQWRRTQVCYSNFVLNLNLQFLIQILTLNLASIFSFAGKKVFLNSLQRKFYQHFHVEKKRTTIYSSVCLICSVPLTAWTADWKMIHKMPIWFRNSTSS